MNLCPQIKEMPENFTASERKLASVLLADYPYAGLETIYSLAQRTHVSTPSISRFVQKLGCSGYQEFQRHLIEEIKEGQQSPIDLRRRSLPVNDSFLHTFLQRTSEVYMRVGEAVTDDQFKRNRQHSSRQETKNFSYRGSCEQHTCTIPVAPLEADQERRFPSAIRFGILAGLSFAHVQSGRSRNGRLSTV